MILYCRCLIAICYQFAKAHMNVMYKVMLMVNLWSLPPPLLSFLTLNIAWKKKPSEGDIKQAWKSLMIRSLGLNCLLKLWKMFVCIYIYMIFWSMLQLGKYPDRGWYVKWSGMQRICFFQLVEHELKKY